VITIVGNAEASKTLAVGTSEADVIKLKIDSMESAIMRWCRWCRRWRRTRCNWFRRLLRWWRERQGGTLVDVLLANLIRDQNNRERRSPATLAG